MKTIYYNLFLILLFPFVLTAQTLEDAKAWYKQKNFLLAKPVFERELQAKPTDPSLNLWYGVSVYETGGDINIAEGCLKAASGKANAVASLYLGDIYVRKYHFAQAVAEYEKYIKLKKTDKEAVSTGNARKQRAEIYIQLTRRTENIQIIDSLVVDKDKFLSAYKLSRSSGKLSLFNDLFGTKEALDATAYTNEKGTKIYYAQKAQDGSLKLYSTEKLLDQYGNEKAISPDNFGLKGDENYPFILPDGITLYFASKDEGSMGGYDLFVTRYNLEKDSYLTPERLNMPFNSIYNDYMLVIDEEKGVGWFASDRFQPEGKVCVYTFIPNDQVKTLESESLNYLASRARIMSIKDTWKVGETYASQIASAKKTEEVKSEKTVDFSFVINDRTVYNYFQDFRNEKAKSAFTQLMSLEKNLSEKEKDLEENRLRYTTADEGYKKQVTEEILSLEKEIESLRVKRGELVIQVRNLENGGK